MSKNQAILDWLKTCPVFASRLSFVSAETNDGDNVVLPVGSSARRVLDDYFDVDGYYNGTIIPNASVYEEYQVQCFRYIGAEQNEYNIMTVDEANDMFLKYDAEGNVKSDELTVLIAAAKAKIRERFPD